MHMRRNNNLLKLLKGFALAGSTALHTQPTYREFAYVTISPDLIFGKHCIKYIKSYIIGMKTKIFLYFINSK